jgi:hypothetical protein
VREKERGPIGTQLLRPGNPPATVWSITQHPHGFESLFKLVILWHRSEKVTERRQSKWSMWTPVCMADSVSWLYGWLVECLSNWSTNDQPTNLPIDFAYLEPQAWSIWLLRKECEALYIRGCGGIFSDKTAFPIFRVKYLLCMWMLQVPAKG